MKRGDFVRVRRAGDEEWTTGMVGIVSSNGRSVGVIIKDAVRHQGGIIAGFLPLLVDDKGVMTFGTDVYEVEQI